MTRRTRIGGSEGLPGAVLALLCGALVPGLGHAACGSDEDCAAGEVCVATTCAPAEEDGSWARIGPDAAPVIGVSRERPGAFVVSGQPVSWRSLRQTFDAQPGTLAESRWRAARRMETTSVALAVVSAGSLAVGAWATASNRPPEDSAAAQDWSSDPALAELQRAMFMVGGFSLATSVVVGALVPAKRKAAVQAWARDQGLAVVPGVSVTPGGAGIGLSGRF